MATQAVAGAAAKKSARSSAKKPRKSTVKDDRPELLSAEGVAILLVAMFFDFIPPLFVLILDIFLGAGELVSWPLDILATIILGGWMWIRGGRMAMGKKLQRFMARRGPFILLEYIPVVGSVGPWWTINAFLFLKK